MHKISLGWAEDNEVFRAGITNFINDQAAHWLDLIVLANNGIELLGAIEKRQPDIILLDMRMPEMDGIQTAKIIQCQYPNVKLIAFTEFDFERNIVEMNKAGVKSFIAKSQAEDLLRAIKIVSEGGVYFPDEVAGILQRYLHKTRPLPTVACPPLSAFERLLLKSICEGKSSTAIGHALHRSPRTIEEHREKLYAKFKVQSKEQLIVKAVEHNLV